MYSREREELIKRGLSFTVRMQHSENLEGATVVDMAGEADSELVRTFGRKEVRLLGGGPGLMNKFAIKGDWKSAELLLRDCPRLKTSVIDSGSGGTALHVAAAVENTKFVRELVNRMSEDDLLIEDKHRYTAFIYAVASGKKEIAELMMEKNPSLNTIREGNTQRIDKTPLYLAASLGNKDMFSYLYPFTLSQDLSRDYWFRTFMATLDNRMYDEALHILKNNKYVAIMRDKDRRNEDRMTALHHLARHHIVDDMCATEEAIFKTLVTLFATVPFLSCLKKKFEQPLMRKKAFLLTERLWDEIQESEEANIGELISTEPYVLHDAAEVGNAGFIPIFTRANPYLIFNTDANNHTIFHTAVLKRQEDVFCFIYKTRQFTKLMMLSVDGDGNNILHLAAKLAPLHRLKIVSGAALQMQRELLWFKKVEKIVPPECLEKKNNAGCTPRELFSKEHEELFKKGEKWMKHTANYCMVVATLIATMAFAAAFTVPGGYNGDSGRPIFLNRSWFTVFVVCDAVAMFFSTSSIIMFLSLLISRYQEDDFLVSLPTKLMLGFVTLFVSIVGTLFGFTSTFVLLFNEEWLRVPEWVIVSACVSLIALFCYQNFRLCIDTFRSAYCSRLLFRQGKYSLL